MHATSEPPSPFEPPAEPPAEPTAHPSASPEGLTLACALHEVADLKAELAVDFPDGVISVVRRGQVATITVTGG